MEIEAHVCEFCERVDVRWVRWQNERGSVRYFCDNDCLVQWIARGLENIGGRSPWSTWVMRRLETS